MAERWWWSLPASLVAGGAAVRILLDHGQVGVQRDADSGIEGDLKGCAHVLRADHGVQLLAVHRLLHLSEHGHVLLGILSGLGLQRTCQACRLTSLNTM